MSTPTATRTASPAESTRSTYTPAEAHQTRIDLDKPAYVPYRALIAPNYPNLLVAGRCLSADRQALASLRVMASCMGTGQAAGVAAAQSVASRRPVQEIDTARLVSTLKDLGAVL